MSRSSRKRILRPAGSAFTVPLLHHPFKWIILQTLTCTLLFLSWLLISLNFAGENSQHNDRLSMPHDTIDSFYTSSSSSSPSSFLCESPSLPRGSLHIVVGGYTDMEAGLSLQGDDNNYLWDLGLTNADVFWYRRDHPEIPLRPTINGPCGMRLHERLLLPNHGRDGGAFYDYILEHYHHNDNNDHHHHDSLPRALVFLHGHGAIAWHQTCEAVFARVTYYYRDMVHNTNNNNKKENRNETTTTTIRVQDHMVDLVKMNPRGSMTLPAGDLGAAALRPCQDFKARWPEYFFQDQNNAEVGKCCGTFIVPGDRIRRYPRRFWEDLQSVIMDDKHPDQGRPCFEHCIWHLLGDRSTRSVAAQKQLLKEIRQEADQLLNETTLQRRMAKCQRLTDQVLPPKQQD